MFLHNTKDHLYLYGCLSLRDAKGPRNIQTCLAKVITTTNRLLKNDNYNKWIETNEFNESYVLNYLSEHGIIIDSIVDKASSYSDTISPLEITDANISQKNFGGIHLLNYISQTIGLTDSLQQIFPQTYEIILAISQYLVMQQRTPLYCRYWAANTDISVKDTLLASQRISEFY
jgi:hypothetical protein